MLGEDPNGVSTERICRFTRQTPQQLGDEFERLLAEKKLLGFAGVWMSHAGFESGAQRLIQALGDLHNANPTEAAIPAALAVAAAQLKWEGKPLDRVLARLATEGQIEIHPNGISLASFHLELTPRQRALLDRVIEALEKEPVNTPSPQAMASSLGIPRQAVEEILKLGVRRAEVLQLAEVVFYTPRQLDSLKSQIEALTAESPHSTTDLRDALKTTRKYIKPIIEALALDSRR